jgi:hypothetical protein
LIDYWCEKLGPCASAMLQTLSITPGHDLAREELATRTGYAETSGGFAKALARLRKLELVEGTRLSEPLRRAMGHAS